MNVHHLELFIENRPPNFTACACLEVGRFCISCGRCVVAGGKLTRLTEAFWENLQRRAQQLLTPRRGPQGQNEQLIE